MAQQSDKSKTNARVIAELPISDITAGFIIVLRKLHDIYSDISALLIKETGDEDAALAIINAGIHQDLESIENRVKNMLLEGICERAVNNQSPIEL